MHRYHGANPSTYNPAEEMHAALMGLFFFFFITLSDTQVSEPYIQALFGTTAHF